MDNQQEYLLPNSWHGKRVKLTSVATDTIFDLYGGRTLDNAVHMLMTENTLGLASNGNRVIGYGNNGSLAQRWYLYKVDQNSAWSPWVLKNANSNSLFILLETETQTDFDSLARSLRRPC